MIRRLAVLLGSAALALPLAEPVGQRSGAVARYLLAMAATATATPAQAQVQKTPITLVSNTSLDSIDGIEVIFSAPSITDTNARVYAQGFRTGLDAAGYIITSVDVDLASVSGKSASVVIRRNTVTESGNRPGNRMEDIIVTLENPDTLQDGHNTFTVPAGTEIVLSPRTSYWLSIHEGLDQASRSSVRRTSSDRQEGPFGWLIRKDASLESYHRSAGILPSAWGTSNFNLGITINGYLNGDDTAPTVSYMAPNPLEVGTPMSLMSTTDDTDIVGYSVTSGTLPDGLMIDEGTGVISGTPTTVSASPSTVTVTVADTSGNTTPVQITFSAVGAAGTLPPVLVEAVLSEFTYAGSVDGTFQTIESSLISLRLSKTITLSGPTSDNLKAAFTVTVDGEDHGISTIVGSGARLRIELSSLIPDSAERVVLSYDRTTAGADALQDEDGNQMASFTRFLRGSSDTPAVNTPPTVATPIPDQTVTVDEPFTFTIPSGTFEDTDTGDTLTYTALLGDGSALPGWLTFAADPPGFEGTPPTAETLTVAVTASDGTASVSDNFDITVAAETVVVEPMPAACPEPDFAAAGRRNIWTSMLEVGVNQESPTVAQHGFTGGTGTLTPTTFTIGANSYTIETLQVGTGGATNGLLQFELTTATPETGLTQVEKASLRLHVCDTVFDFATAPFAAVGRRYTWPNSGLDWSGETMRTLYLSLPENRPATGLPTIASSDGGNVGATLSVATSDVMDEDGLPDTFTYEWVRQGEPISGEMSNTYTLTAADTNQQLRVRVSFTDQLGSDETVESLAWMDGNVNTPPTSADNTVTVAEDGIYTFTPVDFGFMDTDTGDTLDHVVIVTPPVMGELKEETDVLLANAALPLITVIDQGYFTYTPPADFNGAASFTFKVSDGKDESVDDYTMTIDVTAVEDAPTLENPIPDQPATVGELFEFTIPANTFEDADGDPLTYTAALDGGSALPGWLTFDDTNQTFTGTPTTAETLMVRVTASDGTTSVSDVFDITVMAAPVACPAPDFQADGRRPIWTGEVTVERDGAVYGFNGPVDAGALNDTSFAIGTNNYGIREASVHTADSDLYFRLGSQETLTEKEKEELWLHVCDTVSEFDDATFTSFTSRYTWSNSGLDWSGETMRTLYLSLPENRPATGRPEIGSDGSNQAGTTLSLGLTNVMDDDGRPDTFTYQWIRAGVDIPNATADEYMLTAADVGQPFRVRVSFTDQLGNEETVESLTWIDGSLNNAPTGADNTVTTNEDEIYTFMAADFTFMDMDVDDMLDHVVIVTLPELNTGTLRTGDHLDEMAQEEFLEMHGFEPNPNPPLSRVGETISLADIGDLSYNPPKHKNGMGYASFTFRVSDGKDESVEYTMTINVTPVPDAPEVLNAIPDQTATVGEPFSLFISDTDFIDGDGDPLTYTATLADDTALPSWLTFTAANPPEFEGTPTDVGTLTVKVSVTTSVPPVGPAIDEFDIEVREMNTPPTAADNTVMMDEDETYTFTAADFQFADTNAGDSLASVKITAPETAGDLELNGMAVTLDQVITKADIDGGNLTFAPPENANGTGYASFTFRVSDGKDESASYTMTIDVTAVNDAPTSENAIPDQTATVGVPFNFMVPANTFEDTDTGDTLTYTALLADGSALPGWLMFDPANRSFSGTPTAAETLTVRVTATDGGGALVPDDFTITVAAAPVPGNGAPGGSTPGGSTPGGSTPGVGTPEDTAGVSLSTAMLTVSEGSSGVYTVTLNTDPDGPVTITPTSGDGGAVGVSPASLTFTTSDWDMAQTVTVTGVEDDDANNETVTIRHSVSGDGSVTAAGAVTVTVTDTDTAGVSVSPARVSTTEGEAATYTLVLDTLPDGPVTITPTSADNGAVSVSPASLTFTTSDWDMSQTVTVTGVQDDDANGETVTIRHRVSGYGSVTAADVTVNVADDDTAGVSVSPTRVSTTEGEAATYTLVLDTLPDGPVTITPTSGDSGAVSVSPASLTFTPSNWDTAQTVTVTGVQDDDGANETVTISHSVSGYGAVTAAGAVTVTVAEDEAAQEAKAVLEEVALPEVLQQVTARTTEVIASRLNSIASGSSGAPVTLSLEDVVADTVAFFHGEREQLKNGSLEWQEALAGRSFALPLSGLNLAQGESGVSGQEDLFSSLAVWGSGDYTSYGNTIAGTDVDGNGFSGAIGMDLQPMPRLVTGLALTTSRWGLDYTTNTDGSSEAGTYEIGVTTVNPYVNWSATDQLSLWATFGYGRGEVEQTPEGGTADAQTDDLTSWAGGLRFEAIPAVDAPTGEGSPFALAFKVDGAASSFLDTDVQLARLAAEVSRSFTVETGLLTTTLELGWSIRSVSDQDDLDETRKRIADKNDGGGAELAGRLHWLNADSSMSAAVDTRVLLGGGDRREWGIGGQLRLTPSKRDGEGLSITLQPAFGVTGTRLDELWSLSGDGDLAISNDRPGGRLDAELAYGFRHGDALLTPYTEVMLEETASTYGAGLRYGLNPFLELDLKGAHRSRANGDDENRLFLQVYSDL